MTTRLLIVTFSIFFAFAPLAFAQTGFVGPTQPSEGTTNAGTIVGPSSNTGSNITLHNPLGTGTTVNSFILDILSIITDTIGPVIVIFMLVYVGFLFVTARGEPGKLTTAKQALMWTVIGALILLGARVIAEGIYNTVQALSNGS